MGKYADAIGAYEDGLKVEPGLAMLTNGLADAKRALDDETMGGGGGMGQLGNVFGAAVASDVVLFVGNERLRRTFRPLGPSCWVDRSGRGVINIKAPHDFFHYFYSASCTCSREP